MCASAVCVCVCVFLHHTVQFQMWMSNSQMLLELLFSRIAVILKSWSWQGQSGHCCETPQRSKGSLAKKHAEPLC